jgi:dsRNA-specific ribonuclease
MVRRQFLNFGSGRLRYVSAGSSTHSIDIPVMKDRAHLETLLQHKFADAALLDLALTHRSATVNSAVTAPEVTNERLEFLGDRVLGLAIASLLYQHFPHEPEGGLPL